MSTPYTLSSNAFSSEDPGLVPRTAFTIFRNAYLATQYQTLCSGRTIANCPENSVNITIMKLKQAGVFEEAVTIWDSMSSEARKQWQDMAFEEMRDFRRNSPDYVADQRRRVAEKPRRGDKGSSSKARVVFAAGIGSASGGPSAPLGLDTRGTDSGHNQGNWIKSERTGCSAVKRMEDELRYMTSGTADVLDDLDLASHSTVAPIGEDAHPQWNGDVYANYRL